MATVLLCRHYRYGGCLHILVSFSSRRYLRVESFFPLALAGMAAQLSPRSRINSDQIPEIQQVTYRPRQGRNHAVLYMGVRRGNHPPTDHPIHDPPVYFFCDAQRCQTMLGPFRVSGSGAEAKPGSCPGCQSEDSFKIDQEKTMYRNYQKVTLQVTI